MNRLCESTNLPLVSKSGKHLSGLFAEFDTRNQNGRIYPKDIYESALNRIMYKIKEGRLLGECDHPEYDEVKLANVSHVIRDCRIEDNKVYGDVEVLDTPSGKIVQSLIEAGIPIGISSRGVGNTRTTADGTVVTDFDLITFDLVADPSFSGAVLSESAKVKLNNDLNSIERELPLNESVESNSIRNNIRKLRESIEKIPNVTDTLIESIGDLTIKLEESNNKVNDLTNRNTALKSNMSKLQESYTSLKEKYNKSLKVIKENKLAVENKNKLYESELANLRKELAVEKRGLSKSSVMPLLEGLTTTEEIDNKLNSIKQLGTRRRTISENEIEHLTEGIQSSRSTSPLAKLVSSV